jgi:leucyl/phenylalanyl-tRNA---protein transferase
MVLKAEAPAIRDEPFEITPSLLLQAYASGVFPMAESADDPHLHWIDPDQRGILPLDGLHVSRTLRKTISRGDYTVRINSRFDDVVEACADRDSTWINEEIARLYSSLHKSGYAHSVEVYMDDELAGGLYGVALGGAFFGESMFSWRTDASKIALVYLVARLRTGGFRLLDTQFVTDHLKSLGAIEIPRVDYHERLAEALDRVTNFWKLPENAPPQLVLQLSTQIS